ncbi:MAG: diacylglycerol kinase [Gemmataceae bacterium]|nr:diacylglycerol kinase [Gemmataceae bacterium]
MSWQSPSSSEVPGPIETLPWDSGRTSPSSKPRRRWREKFEDAFRGLKLGIRGHSSFFVHFFFAALVIAAAIVLRCTLLEWCILLGCIGMVLTAELFNSAVETLFHGQDAAAKARTKDCLDIAAGAVLMASAVALVIGAVVFIHRLALMLGIE